MSGQVIPGPWEISGGSIWGTSPLNARVRIAEVTRFSPMNGIDSEGHEHQIAATPELLEACKFVLEHGFLRKWDGDERAFSMLKAAIAKANGSAA